MQVFNVMIKRGIYVFFKGKLPNETRIRLLYFVFVNFTWDVQTLFDLACDIKLSKVR